MLKRYGIYLVITLLLVAASLLIYRKLHPQVLPANLIAGSGRIDGDLVVLGTKYPGRLNEVNVSDGQHVTRGQSVAVLQSDEFQAKLRSLDAGIAAAIEGVRAQKKELETAKIRLPIEIKKAQNALTIAQIRSRELERSIATLSSVVAQDRRDFNRTKTLYDKQLIDRKKLELAQLKLTDDSNKLAALQEKKKQSAQQIDIAESNVVLAKSGHLKLEALEATIAASEKKVAALQANRDELRITIAHLSITSPVNGYIVEKIALTGEVLAAGAPVATLIDPQSLYLKMFIDTLENGRVKVGDKAVIFLDASPDRPIAATVVRVAQKAEFTPKEVSVRSDRIQRVFAVHLKPMKPDPLLKLGLPAIGVITTDGKGLPGSLEEIPAL